MEEIRGDGDDTEQEAKYQSASSGWAKPVDRVRLGGVDGGVAGLNLEGRRLTGPLQGFGQMWQKTYRVNLGQATSPAAVIKAWKENYAVFWPPGNRFYAPLTGIAPGEVGVIKAAQGPIRLSTGVMVIYADEESFTFMTPQGHPFAGFVTFSAYEEDGGTIAQVQLLIRPNDPIYEVAFMVFAGRQEDRIWQHTLRSLAAFFDVEAEVDTVIVCVDRKRQWSKAGEIWQNAGARTMLHALSAPVRAFRRDARR